MTREQALESALRELEEAVLAWAGFWEIEMPPVGTYHRLKEHADRIRAARADEREEKP